MSNSFATLMECRHAKHLYPWDFPGQSSVQFSSVAQLCSTLWDPMNCTHQDSLSITNCRGFLKLMSTDWWQHPAISSSVLPFSSCLQSFHASRSFQMSQLFSSGGQSIGVSASTSILPMNTQDWSPLGWTGWVSLQSKGVSRVFSKTTVQKHQYSVLSFLYSPTLTSIYDYWKNHSLD